MNVNDEKWGMKGEKVRAVHHYFVLDYDDDRNMIAKRTEYSIVLEVAVNEGFFPKWDMAYSFGGQSGQITIYGATFEQKPTGENMEMVEVLVMKALLDQ